MTGSVSLKKRFGFKRPFATFKRPLHHGNVTGGLSARRGWPQLPERISIVEQQTVRRPRWLVWSVLRSGIVLVGLLFMNSFLVNTFLDTSAIVADDLRISQTLQFFLPLLLIFLEYWVYDFLRRLATVNRES
jgi:hypothetical protein